MSDHKVMPIDQLILHVERICRQNKVAHLSLFGSHATGTATERSDVDFIIYGCENKEKLTEDIDNIPTLRKIDLFFYDEIYNKYLKEDIDQYGKPIY